MGELLAWSVGKRCGFNGTKCKVVQVGRAAQGGVDPWRVELLSRGNTKMSWFWAGLTGMQAEGERDFGKEKQDKK